MYDTVAGDMYCICHVGPERSDGLSYGVHDDDDDRLGGSDELFFFLCCTASKCDMCCCCWVVFLELCSQEQVAAVHRDKWWR